MEDEFLRIVASLGYIPRKWLKLQIYIRLYRRSIFMVGYPAGVLLLSLILSPGEKIVFYSMAIVSIVYARIAVKLLKW